MFSLNNRMLAVLGIFLLTACMGTTGTGVHSSHKTDAPRPKWTTEPPRQAGYIFGVGSVETYGNARTAIQRAQEAARVDLLSQLRVTVSGTMQTSIRVEGDDERFASIHKVVQQETSSRVQEIEMTGIEITETWLNPAETEAWALARLNRAKTESELLFGLEDLEDTLLNRGTGTGSTLDRIRHIIPSLTDLEERRQILNQLTFLAAGSQIPDREKGRRVDALQAEIRNLLASLTIRLEPQNDDAIKMLGIMAQTLTRMGFNLHDEGADLRIRLSISMTPVSRNQIFHVVTQAEGQVQTPEGRTLYALRESGRSSSSDPQIARNKAVEDMALKLADALASGLFQHL
ncbi:LPP20 family lipoprotein [Desulfobotulus sp. H1]|uniref:LPP20 family lipoprotein n=1 Tax=Desulfobotulus pelophilus TaxID=2823377 RepID=A0ABT3N9T5_9BACT|nr:LPP20 family lipoprotein [Desulfobotulus pelophilus]MCW7753737.1 LPP20 family lipoprotein [Desulfobotulus pelophilus]